jgi:hypothetical protein
MTHNIIKKENYLLIVDDSKIELGSWHTCIYPEYPLEARFTDESTKYDICKGCKNIIAHLPLNNAPALEGVDLLPLIEPIGFDNYKYTDEDIAYLYNLLTYDDLAEDEKIEACNEHIKFVQQPKMPIGVECEIEYIGFQDEGDLEVPKSFINSQGLTQWVGEYIY